MLIPGSRAPAFRLPTVGGDTLTLEGLLAGHHSLLLVFLRHLG